MEPENDKKRNTLRAVGVTAVVCLLVAGVAGYAIGYHRGQRDFRLQIGGTADSARASSNPSESSGSPAPEGQSQPPQSVWDVDEEKSPVDDSPTVVLSAPATKAPPNLIGMQQAVRLIIRCKEHSTDLYVALDEYLGTQSSAVVYRIDDEPSQTASWSDSTDGKAVFADDPVALARKLTNANKLFVRISDFQGTAYDFEFKISGLAKVLPKVAAACAWK